MSVPKDLKYTTDHEWVRHDGDAVVVGITTHAQEQLGDVVFVELPEVGRQVKKGDTFGTVESVKAVSDLYAPLSGKVLEVNGALKDSPDLVNSDPFGGAWMIKLQPADANELKALLDAATYEASL